MIPTRRRIRLSGSCPGSIPRARLSTNESCHLLWPANTHTGRVQSIRVGCSIIAHQQSKNRESQTAFVKTWETRVSQHRLARPTSHWPQPRGRVAGLCVSDRKWAIDRAVVFWEDLGLSTSSTQRIIELYAFTPQRNPDLRTVVLVQSRSVQSDTRNHRRRGNIYYMNWHWTAGSLQVSTGEVKYSMLFLSQ